MLIQRVACGETLKEVCEGQGLAYSLVAKHIASVPAIKAEYDGALQIWADALAQETVAIADEQSEVEKKDGTTYDPDVARDKLRVETRLKLAGKLYRERYGEREAPLVALNVNLGDVAREIRMLEERLGLSAAKPVEALPAPVTVDQNGGII